MLCLDCHSEDPRRETHLSPFRFYFQFSSQSPSDDQNVCADSHALFPPFVSSRAVSSEWYVSARVTPAGPYQLPLSCSVGGTPAVSHSLSDFPAQARDKLTFRTLYAVPVDDWHYRIQVVIDVIYRAIPDARSAFYSP
jgi:hypothetical protein